MLIQFNNHFPRVTLIDITLINFQTIHMLYHNKTSIAEMANMIGLDSFRKLFFCSNFETRSFHVLEQMKSIFGPVRVNPVNIEPSNINETWPRFKIISNNNFCVNSPLVPCILCSVNVKPTGVIKLLCGHPNLTWKHANNFCLRPLTNITKGPSMPLQEIFQIPSKPIWTSATAYPHIASMIK